jgi:hypothetical protein
LKAIEIMTTTTSELDQQTYVQLRRRALPRGIHMEGESERLTKEFMPLDELPDSLTEEKELDELQTVLIDGEDEPTTGSPCYFASLRAGASVNPTRPGSRSRDVLTGF